MYATTYPVCTHGLRVLYVFEITCTVVQLASRVQLMLATGSGSAANATGRGQAAMGVLSATLVGLEASTRTLAAPVRLMFDNVDPSAALMPSRCVFWDWGAGAWARNGCALATDAGDTCICSHLTYFSLLFVRNADLFICLTLTCTHKCALLL